MEEYKDLEFENVINVCKDRKKYVYFFDNWFLEFEDFGEKILGFSKFVLYKFIVKDIDIWVKEVNIFIGYNKGW